MLITAAAIAETPFRKEWTSLVRRTSEFSGARENQRPGGHWLSSEGEAIPLLGLVMVAV